jgi:hypothetical protein
MSALPSSAAAVDSRTLTTPAAGSLSVAAVAGQHALPTDEAHANTAMLARTAVSVMPLDSAVDVHPNGVTPIAAAAAVVELQAAAGAPLPSPSSADSAKSLAGASLGSSAQPQGEGQQRSGSRDNREKLFSSPSRGQIGSDPKAMLLTSTAQSQPAQPQGPNSSPSPSSSAAAASSGVGAGGAAAKNSASAPPSLSAAFAAAELTFRQHKASPPSSAAAQHDDMRDDDGSAAAGSPSSALPETAKHCLVIDIQQIASSDKDCAVLNAIRNNTGLSWDGRIAAVLEWLPALERDGLVWVGRDSRFVRLHLHFKDHSFLARALKAVPFLVRCCVPSGSAWGGYSCPCNGLPRHNQPEALYFTVDPTEAVPAQPSALLSTIKDFLKRISIDVQLVWQSSSQGGGQRATVPHQRITFWVLPREADRTALVALINRVHQKHTLFGGAVHVQGPNNKQTVRCPECRELGHQGDACPKFGGTAVRLRFKDPLSPYDFRVLLEGTHCRSAMLGNTHSENDWAPSHKATLFFDEPTSEEAIASFTTTLRELTARYSGRLFEPPTFVMMTQAQRKLECLACGDRDKVHQCLSKSTALSRPSVPQQPAASKVAAAAPTAAPAATSAPASSASKGASAAKAAPAPTYVESLLKGMCGEWRASRHCKNRDRCKRTHPEEWVIIPDSICNDFLKHGSCKWTAEKCKFPHVTFEQLKARTASPASAAVATPVAAPKAAAPKATSIKKAANAAPRGGGSNMFAPLASATVAAAASAAPTTPRKGPPLSSLDSLASPSTGLTRSHSTPTGTPSTSAKKKLALGGGAHPAVASAASAASAAAAVDKDGFQQQKQKKGSKRRRGATSPAQAAEEAEEEKEQTSRKASKPTAAQEQAEIISVSSNDMEQ